MRNVAVSSHIFCSLCQSVSIQVDGEKVSVMVFEGGGMSKLASIPPSAFFGAMQGLVEKYEVKE